MCPSGKSTGGNVIGANGHCLAAHGFRFQDVYQPLSRFWPLQSIETGIVGAAAVVLLAAAAWWTMRRAA